MMLSFERRLCRRNHWFAVEAPSRPTVGQVHTDVDDFWVEVSEGGQSPLRV
jgi:hypothetical protein